MTIIHLYRNEPTRMLSMPGGTAEVVSESAVPVRPIMPKLLSD